jgi:hypothetical protein
VPAGPPDDAGYWHESEARIICLLNDVFAIAEPVDV